MSEPAEKLSDILAGHVGSSRTDCGDFPWDCIDTSVWYAFLVVENGKIARYGFTSSRSSKEQLCNALKSVSINDEVLLLGVWTGKYSTHLFVIDPAVALEQLRHQTKSAYFEQIRSATNVTKAYGPRGGFRYLSFSYTDNSGKQVRSSIRSKADAGEIEAVFKEQGIPIRELR